jgi:hypothetical protein
LKDAKEMEMAEFGAELQAAEAGGTVEKLFENTWVLTNQGKPVACVYPTK